MGSAADEAALAVPVLSISREAGERLQSLDRPQEAVFSIVSAEDEAAAAGGASRSDPARARAMALAAAGSVEDAENAMLVDHILAGGTKSVEQNPGFPDALLDLAAAEAVARDRARGRGAGRGGEKEKKKKMKSRGRCRLPSYCASLRRRRRCCSASGPKLRSRSSI
jgi:hypothetical protein